MNEHKVYERHAALSPELIGARDFMACTCVAVTVSYGGLFPALHTWVGSLTACSRMDDLQRRLARIALPTRLAYRPPETTTRSHHQAHLIQLLMAPSYGCMWRHPVSVPASCRSGKQRPAPFCSTRAGSTTGAGLALLSTPQPLPAPCTHACGGGPARTACTRRLLCVGMCFRTRTRPP